MIKRIQNKVAESRLALPVMAVFACLVWVLAGVIQGQWWMQFVCFAVSTYLMVELNNGNALIRIYSRMVSCAFLLMSCASCFLFPSLGGAIVELCFIASFAIAFHCYQDKQSPGWTFYSFLCLGLASLVFVQTLYLVPLFWLLMKVQLNSMSWRTFFASIIGLAMPYWFALCWLLFRDKFELSVTHFQQLAEVRVPFDYSMLTVQQVALYVFVVVLAVTGTIHFWRNSIDDKIRIRQFFSCFITVDAVVLIMLALQPQHYDMLFRMAVVCTAPLIGHFIALTRTRITNIAFFAIVAVGLLLTVLSLWMPSMSL